MRIYGKYAMKNVKIVIINVVYCKGMRKSMSVHIIINARKNAQFVSSVNAMKKIVIAFVIINQVILMFINVYMYTNVWKNVVRKTFPLIVKVDVF